MELVRLELPLRHPLRSAHGTERLRDLILVRIELDGVDGWGECSALTSPTYSGEFTAAAWTVLRDHLVPAALSGVDLQLVGHPFARAALHHACLDAHLRAEGRSLASHLGARATRVPAGVVVGLGASPGEVAAAVDSHVGTGYRRVKVKVVPGRAADTVAEIRRRHADLELAVDANGSFGGLPGDAATTAHAELAALAEHGVSYVEQPCPARDLAGSAELAGRLLVPICLDESIGGADDARTAAALGAGSIINVKPGRVGGLDEVQALRSVAGDRGLELVVGGMLESGVGRAVCVALAAAVGGPHGPDLAASAHYFDDDITEPFVLDPDGCLAVPAGPGIGVVPDADRLARATVERVTLRPA